MILFNATSRRACALSDDKLTTGSVGIQVEFTFSADWEAAPARIAVFRGSGQSVDVALLEGSCTVPPEVLTQPGSTLTIGVYGTDGAGTVVIPTVYAEAGRIVRGAEPSGVEPTPETQPLIAQLLAAAQAARDAAEAAEALAQSVRDDADAGEFDGEDGEDGNGIWFIDAQYTRTISAGVQAQLDHMVGRPGATPAVGDLCVVSDGRFGAVTSLTVRVAVVPVLGDLSGKSAYELAAEHGYTGTEAEWLESLQGEDGFAPEVTIETIEGGHRVTITSAAHPEGQSFDVMDGQGGSGSDAFVATYTLGQTSSCDKTYAEIMAVWQAGQTVIARGTGEAAGQTANVYANQSGDMVVILTVSAGAMIRITHTSADTITWDWLGIDITDIQGLDQLLAAYRTATDQDFIDQQQNAAIAAKYSKPSGGIPASDLAAGVIPTVPSNVSAFSNDAGYLTQHQDISGKLDKAQGAANAGKFLVVGSDGNITTVTMSVWQGGSF